MSDQAKRLLFPVRGCKRDERVQKIGQELMDKLNSWAAEFVAGDRTVRPMPRPLPVIRRSTNGCR
jgi:hypothetical protein